MARALAGVAEEPEPRARIGVILLASDLATEPALAAMAPADVAMEHARLRNREPCVLDNLRAQAEELVGATRLLAPGTRLDAIAFACTSATMAIGVEAVEARIHEARPGVAVATPMTATIRALECLGASRIAMVAPYVEEVTDAMAAYLRRHGIDVARQHTFGLGTDAEMVALTVAEIDAAARALDGPDIEAIFLACTGMRGYAAVAGLERALDKPVLASHQALLWQALRQAGYRAPIDGYGRLLMLCLSL